MNLHTADLFPDLNGFVGSDILGMVYFTSLWQVPIELDKCTVNVSMMSGVGGKVAILLLSGSVQRADVNCVSSGV